MNSTPWLQYVSQKLAGNGYRPMDPEKYQPLGFKYGVHRSRFEPSKFGMAERFFLFAEIPNLDIATMRQFSTFAFQFANKNKSASLPNGFFMCVFCFAVVITENLDPQVAQSIRDASPVKHWSAFEMPVLYDVASGDLVYFQKTPLWGAAYHAAFRRHVEENLR